MAGIKNPSMRDLLPTASERFKKRGLVGLISGPTEREKQIAEAFLQFQQGTPGEITGAGPLEGGYVPLSEGQVTPGQPAGDVNALLQNLIGAGPEGVAQAQQIASMFGLGKGKGSQGSDFFGNVQYIQDEQGNLNPYLINKTSGKLVPIDLPEGGVAAVPSTIKETTGGEFVQIPTRGAPGRRPVTTPIGRSAAASATEAKQTGQQEVALEMADRMRELVEKDKVQVGPASGRLLSTQAATGIGLDENGAELLSLAENYSNQLIQAMRGAQVGPKEQIMFNKSLPRVNQPKELFLKNLQITQKNLRTLNKRASKMRPVPRFKERRRQEKKAEWKYNPATGKLEPNR